MGLFSRLFGRGQKPASPNVAEAAEDAFSMQLVEVHFRRSLVCDYMAIRARAQEILKSELDSPNPSEVDEGFLLFHKQHTVRYADGELPAQTAILATREILPLDKYRQDIQQSWRCRGPEELLRGSKETRLVTEMMARPLPPPDRLSLFHGVLQAVIEITAPDALVFKHSQQVVSPTDYQAACVEKPILRPGALNVRFFKIGNSDGDMLMDTRGLADIGLHDLQCHFRQLNPDDVSRVLLNTAIYIFENGPVIESGQTVAGIGPASKWRCQFENSLVEPRREVLDLNPGEPYAAGDR